MPEPTRRVKHKEVGTEMIINEVDFDPKLHEAVDGKANERSSPTIEEYVAAGYQPTGYPPEGHKEVDSPGLKVHKAWLKIMANQNAETGAASGTGTGAPAPSTGAPATPAGAPAAPSTGSPAGTGSAPSTGAPAASKP